MGFPSLMDAAILELLQTLRKTDSDTVTTWMDDKTLCFILTGSHSGAKCRAVRKRLKVLSANKKVMWKVMHGVLCWALNDGQFRGEPYLYPGHETEA